VASAPVAAAALVYPAGHLVNTAGEAVVKNHPGLATEQTETSPVHDVHPSIVVQSVQAVITELATVLANPALHELHTSGVPAVQVPHPATAQATQVPAVVPALATALNPDLQVVQSSVAPATVQTLQLVTVH